MRRLGRVAWAFVAAAMAGGCAGPPKGLPLVKGFEVDRYLGKWYEIARLDHRFERGLIDVTAEYSLRDDGGIDVVNRGYDARRSQWRQTRGVARFLGEPDVASLKVTFFWPFWGAYHVIALDRENYSYAMVTSSSRSYLWILARRPQMDAAILEELLGKAASWGFDTKDLIFVEHRAEDGPGRVHHSEANNNSNNNNNNSNNLATDSHGLTRIEQQQQQQQPGHGFTRIDADRTTTATTGSLAGPG